MERQQQDRRRLHGPSKRVCQQGSHHPKQSLDVPHFSGLHDTQNLWRSTSSFRPKIREQPHQTTVYPLHGPPALKTNPTSRCVDGMSRHSRCIPSHQDASGNEKIPVFSSQRKTVRIHIPSVWPKRRSPGVHFRPTSHHLSTTLGTHKCAKLFGRPHCLGQLSRSLLKGDFPNSYRPPRIWIPDPPRKITTSSKPAKRMARFPVEHGDRHCISVPTQCRQDPSAVLPHPKAGTLHQVGDREPLRSVGIRLSTSSSDSFPQAISDSHPQRIPKRQFKEEPEPGTGQPPPDVGKHRRLERERAPSSPSSRRYSLDRCIKDRMGSARCQREHHEWRVGTTSSTSPHQRSRIKNSRNCTIQSSSQRRPICSCLHGQRSNLLHMHEAGLNKESPDASSIQGVARYHHTEKINPNSQTDSGHPQCPSRCPISPKSHPDGVGIRSARLRQDSALGRLTRGRLDGNPLQLKTANVYLSLPTSTSSSSGRSLNPMEQVAESIFVPPNVDARPTSTSDPELQRNAGPHPGSSLFISTPNSTSVLGKGLTTSPPSPQPVCGWQDSPSTMVSICSMDRTAFLHRIFSRRYGEELADSLMKGFRESTRRQQEHAWRVFQEWIMSRPITILSLPLLLQFIRWLRFQKNFASQTIASYKSALALPIKEATGLDLSDPHFSLLLKSLFLEKPPQRFPEIRWNLTKVLQFLRQPRFKNTDASEGDLLHKCLFLTALATGNRGAEMAAFSREGISHRQDGSIVLAVRPGFLYKNQSANRTPPSIVIRPLARNQLCPVSNLTQYLAKSATTQGHLFIHPVSKRPLNRGQISFRVCKLIKEADPSGIPQLHDLRRAAASIAWTRGVSTTQITQSAFWSNSNVFIKRYLKQCSAPQCVALGTKA